MGLTKARVYPFAQRLLVDDLLQQGEEALAVGLTHPLRQLLLVLGGDLAAAGEAALAFRGQVEGADAPVLRVRPPLDQAALLEFVDQGDHAAGGNFDRRADRLLRLPLAGGDEVEDAEEWR